jgi:hypothetical protein
MSAGDTTKNKTRTRRSSEKIAELILEAERRGNSAEICRLERLP